MRHCRHEPAKAGCAVCVRYDADDPPGYRDFSDMTAVRLGYTTPKGSGGPCKCGGKCGDCAGALEWISTADLARDSARLAALLPADCAGIVGIPRSGLVPAGVIATLLHLPLYSLEPAGPRPVSAGSRGASIRGGGGPLAVVDDTVYGGGAMTRARKVMERGGRPAVFAAVYVRPGARAAADIYVRELPSPHILEWNFANNGPMRGFAQNSVYGSGVAWDIDGIIVHDRESGGPIDSPYLVPRAYPARLIVTGRYESRRGPTEALLRRLGVRWDRLEMLPDGVPQVGEKIAAMKARHYRASACGLFIESDRGQAVTIAALAGKPVVCPIAGAVFRP